MTNVAIYLAKQDDETFIAVSIDAPRFCVQGATEAKALAKAERAIDYYNENKHKVLDVKARETRIITPAFEEKELCLS